MKRQEAEKQFLEYQEELNKKLTLRSFNVEFPLDCIQAIEKYQDSNVLLIVSPPPFTPEPIVELALTIKPRVVVGARYPFP